MPDSILKISKHVNIVATTVVEQAGRYLMVQENKKTIRGLWNFTSGKLDLGETVLEAAVREAKEEGGVDVILTGVYEIGFEQWMDGEGVSVRFVFQGMAQDQEVGKEVAKDVMAAEWKTAEELRELLESKKLRNEYTEHLATMLLDGAAVHPLSLVHCFTNDFTLNTLEVVE